MSCNFSVWRFFFPLYQSRCRLGQSGTRMGPARLAGDRQDQGVTTLERENDRLKRIVAEKELELDISRKVRRL